MRTQAAAGAWMRAQARVRISRACRARHSRLPCAFRRRAACTLTVWKSSSSLACPTAPRPTCTSQAARAASRSSTAPSSPSAPESRTRSSVDGASGLGSSLSPSLTSQGCAKASRPRGARARDRPLRCKDKGSDSAFVWQTARAVPCGLGMFEQEFCVLPAGHVVVEVSCNNKPSSCLGLPTIHDHQWAPVLQRVNHYMLQCYGGSVHHSTSFSVYGGLCSLLVMCDDS
eukprot:2462854-Pleurochrysis_carterae.AAC.4